MGITVPGRGGLEQVLRPGAPEPTYPCLGDELIEGLLGTQARATRELLACGDNMRYSQTPGNPGLLSLYLQLMRPYGQEAAADPRPATDGCPAPWFRLGLPFLPSQPSFAQVRFVGTQLSWQFLFPLVQHPPQQALHLAPGGKSP